MKVKQNKIRILRNVNFSDNAEWIYDMHTQDYEDEINEVIYKETTTVGKNNLPAWKLVDIKVSATATRGYVYDAVILFFEREVDPFNDCEVRWDNKVILPEEEETI